MIRGEVTGLGEDGLLIRFADKLDMDANALAIDAARVIERASIPGVLEIAPALVSVYVRFDPLLVDLATLAARVEALLPEAVSPGDAEPQPV